MLGIKMDLQAAWVKIEVTVAIFFFFFLNFVMALVPTFIDGFQYYFICLV